MAKRSLVSAIAVSLLVSLRAFSRALVTSLALAMTLHTVVEGQIAAPNTPVLPPLPRDLTDPDAILKTDLLGQRQLEAEVVVSTRNAQHLISFFNDYRSVDISHDTGIGGLGTLFARNGFFGRLFARLMGKPIERPRLAAAEATTGIAVSADGGFTWTGGLTPGSFDDDSPAGLLSPAHGLEAMTDPRGVAAPCGIAYLTNVAFTRGGRSMVLLSKFQDTNASDGGQTWRFLGQTVIEAADNPVFLDLPYIAIDVPRWPTADPCDHVIYVAYAKFLNGNEFSRIRLAKSFDSGRNWQPIVEMATNTRTNQGVVVAVDPRPGLPFLLGGGVVYVGWRVFGPSSPDAMMISQSFTFGFTFETPRPINSTPLYAYDQPSLGSSAVGPQHLAFRSNAFMTLAVVPHPVQWWRSTVFAAWQERVDVASCGAAAPANQSCGAPYQTGDPRIVVSRSTDFGFSWRAPGGTTNRTAIDIGDRDRPGSPDFPKPGFGYLPQPRPSGQQMMPRFAFSGGRLALGYLEARGPLTVLPAPALPFATGLSRQTDARLALLDPASGLLLGTNQVSRYPIRVGARLDDGESREDLAELKPGVPIVSERSNAPSSGGGQTPFFGDYVGLAPVTTFIFNRQTGRWRYAFSPFDPTFRGFHFVFPDSRHVVPPEGATPEQQVAEWPNYAPPGMNMPSCTNPGARNHDVMHSLVDVSVPVNTIAGFKRLGTIARNFPVTFSNVRATKRFFRASLAPATIASFDQTDPVPDQIDLEILPYSSATKAVTVASSDPLASVTVNVAELAITCTAGEPALANPACTVAVDPAGERGTVTLNLDPTNVVETPATDTARHNPIVTNPIVTNPIVTNPIVTNDSAANPIVTNPIVTNPIVTNDALADKTVYGITDVTWTVTNNGTDATSYTSRVALENFPLLKDNYVFHLLIYRVAAATGVEGCNTTALRQDQIISSIPNPIVTNPIVTNPIVTNPIVTNPIVTNPIVTNSTFAAAPAETGIAAAVRARSASGAQRLFAPDGTMQEVAADAVYVTLRGYQIVPNSQLTPQTTFDPVQTPPAISVKSETANTIGGVVEDTPPEDSEGTPDLAIEGYTPAPNGLTANVGGTVTLSSFAIRNQGDAPSNSGTGSFRSGVYLSTNPAIDPLEDLFLGGVENTNADLPAGAVFQHGALTVAIPSVAPGNYFIGVYINDQGLDVESTLANNFTSEAITIGSGTPVSGLLLRTAPSAVTTGQPLLPAVQIEARSGTGAVAAGIEVNLSLAANPAGATLSGATAITNALGIAAFPNLRIDRSASGYTLQATAAGFPSLTTGAFTGFGRSAPACNVALSFNTTPALPMGTDPSSIVTADFNRDGFADLATANRSTDDVAVRLGAGNGTFGGAQNYPTTGSRPTGIVAGDFNRDGWIDLATANSGDGNVSVLLNNGSGSFLQAQVFATASHPSRSIGAGDVDGDGRLDLLVLAVADDGPLTSVVDILIGDGAGGFATGPSHAAGINAHDLAVADFNGDGRADVAVAHDQSGPGLGSVSILRAGGPGGFFPHVRYPLPAPAVGVAAGDLDNDGILDLAVASGTAIELLRGNGTAGFTLAGTVPIPATARDVAITDFSGDGLGDIVSTTSTNLIAVLVNGPGGFRVDTFPSTEFGGVAVGDWNGDFRADIAAADRLPGTDVTVLINSCAANLLIVTNTNDSGPGSLRDAIATANGVAGANVIAFNIPGGGVHTITPLSPLPTITDPAVVDGSSQLGWTSTPLIEIAGTSAGAGAHGLRITANDSMVSGLTINRFNGSGILLEGSDAFIVANLIGTDATGTAAQPNAGGGIVVTGSNNVIGRPGARRNVVSGNQGSGININGGVGNRLQGNYVGLDVTGTAAIGNSPFGISVFTADGTEVGGTGAGEGNVVAGSSSINISVQGGADNNTIQGNKVGTNAAGTAVAGSNGSGIYLIGSNGNLVGGTTAAARNVIAGSTGTGQVVLGVGSTGNHIEGNYIGTNAAGTAALANGTWGIQVGGAGNFIGGTAAGAGNLISGNAAGGVVFFGAGSGNEVLGNRIGTAADGSTALPNQSYGIGVQGPSGNTIGSTAPGGANVIAFNTGAGVAVAAGTQIPIRGNSIFGNAGLGIDLGPAGVTANDPGDADTGANNLQNFPVLTSAASNGASIAVQGTLTSTPGTAFTIDIYSGLAGEGRLRLASVNVTTDGNGAGTFGTIVPLGPTSITATATDSAGNTSEFSAPIAVTTGGEGGVIEANNETAATLENQPVTVNVLANDKDADGVLVASYSFAPSATPVHMPNVGDLTIAPRSGQVYLAASTTASAMAIYDPEHDAVVDAGNLIAPSSGSQGKANPATGILYYRNATGLVGVDARPGSPTFNQLITMPAFPGRIVPSFAIDHERGLLYAGLRTNFGPQNSEVAVIDVSPGHELTPTVLRTVTFPAGTFLQAVEVNKRTGRLYVATSGGANAGLWIVEPGDTDGNREGFTNTSVFSLAVNEAEDLVYALVLGFSTPLPTMFVLALDGTTGTALAVIPAAAINGFTLSDKLMAVDETTGRVYVATGLGTTPGGIVVIDGKRTSSTFNAVVTTIPITTFSIALDPAAGVAIAGGSVPNSPGIHLIDLATNTFTTFQALQGTSGDITLNPNTHRAFVAVPGAVLEIDTNTRVLTRTIHTGADQGASAVNPATHTAYFARTDIQGTAIEAVRADGTRATIQGPHALGRYVFVAADTNQQRIYAANQSADVTGSTFVGQGFLTIIDATTNQVLANVPAGPGPFGLAVDESANKIYVANLFQGGMPGGMTIVDGAAPYASVAANVSAFGANVAFGRDVIVGPTGKVYARVISGTFANGVGVLNPSTNVVTPLPTALGDIRVIRADTLPRNRMFLGAITILNGQEVHEVVVLDGATDTQIIRIPAGFPSPLIGTGQYMAVDGSRNRIYVADYNAGTLTAIDGATLQIITAIPVGARPTAVVVDPAVNRIYVTNGDERSMSIVDGATLAEVSRVKIPFRGSVLSIDPSSNTLFVNASSLDQAGIAVVSDAAAIRGTTVTVTPGAAGNGALQVNADNTITYTPAGVGTDTFTYTLTDSTGASDTGTVTVNVIRTNQAPVAMTDAFTTNEDTVLVDSVLTNDTFTEAVSSLRVSLVRGPKFGTLALQVDGSLTYTPQLNFHGGDSFEYSLSDDAGGETRAIATITINPLEDGNQVAAGWTRTLKISAQGLDGVLDALAIDQTTGALFVKERLGGADINLYRYNLDGTLAANGSYPLGQNVRSGIGLDPTTGTILTGDFRGPLGQVRRLPVPGTGTGTLHTEFSWQLDPAANQTGQLQFAPHPGSSEMEMWDNTTATLWRLTGGGLLLIRAFDEGTPQGQHTATAGNDVVWVERYNTAVLSDGSTNAILAVEEDEPEPFNVFGALPGKPTALAIDNSTVIAFVQIGTSIYGGSGEAGTLQFIGDIPGLVDITVGPATTGSGRSLYALANNQVHELRWTGDPPIARDDTLVVPEGTGPVNVAVLANDTDPAGGPLAVVSFTQPAIGTVQFGDDGRTLQYMPPNVDFFGTATFSYVVGGFGPTSSATVTVTYTAVNDAPVAISNTYQTAQNTPLDVVAPGVLANDTDGDGPGPLTAQLVTPPAVGDLTFRTDGSFTYGPPNGFTGNVTFTYRASDGITTGGTATVTINVLAPLTFTTTALREAIVFQTYSNGLAFTGGRTPITLSLAPGSNPLPANLIFNGTFIQSQFLPSPAVTPPLMLSGIFPIGVRATDSSTPVQQTATRQFDLRISARDQGASGTGVPAFTFGITSALELAQTFTTGVTGQLSSIELFGLSCPAGVQLQVELQGVTGTTPAQPNGTMFAQGQGTTASGPIQLTNVQALAVGSKVAVIVRAVSGDCTANYSSQDSYQGGTGFSRVVTGGVPGPWQTLQSTRGAFDVTFNSLMIQPDALYMDRFRQGHTATRLASGKVLIVGGFATNSTFGAVYDPATRQFTLTENEMSARRANHTATLMSNGKVLIAGGSGLTAGLNSAEEYDPATNRFTPLPATLAFGRAFHTATALDDGRVLIVGGTTADGTGVTAVEMFNGTTFSVLAHLTAARWSHTATLLQSGKVLLFGGFWSGASQPPSGLTFDPVANTFAAAANSPQFRDNHTATRLASGDVLIAGGREVFPAYSTHYLLYRAATDTFEQGAPMALPRMQHTATLLDDGSVLVAGGDMAIYPTPQENVASIERFVPSAGAGSAAGAGSMLITRAQHTAVPIQVGGETHVFMTGGFSRSQLTGRSSEVVDPADQAFAITTMTLPDGSVGSPYTTTVLQTMGAAGTVTFSVAAGALPNGLTLESNGTIHGTPTVPGPMSFVVAAVDTGSTNVAYRQLTITINRLVITTAALPTGVVGVPYSAQLEASGIGAITWTVDCCTLAPGLTLNADGSITGTSTTAGFFFVRFRARDAIGQLAVRSYTIDVTQALTVSTSPFGLGDTAVFWFYGGGLQATGGRFPYEWSITDGTLPPGVSLSSFGGFSGNVEDTGNYTFTARVQDASNPRQFASAPLTIRSGANDQDNNITDLPEQWITLGPGITAAQAFRTGLEGSLLNVSFVVECFTGDLVVRLVHVAANGQPDDTRVIAGNTIPGNVLQPYVGTPFSRQLKLFTAVPVPLDAPVAITMTTAGNCRVAKTRTGVDYAYGRGFVNSGTGYTPLSQSDPTRDDFAFFTNVQPDGQFTWTQAGRGNHTETMLPNGHILLAGGVSQGPTALTYDPATKRYTPTANDMSVKRLDHTATLLNDGRVLVTGGAELNSTTGIFATAEIYDPVTRLWAPVGTMSHARTRHTATLLADGSVLIAGGVEVWGQPTLDSMERYVTATGQFVAAGTMSGGRAAHTATRLSDGSVLLAGGWLTPTTQWSERFVPGSGVVPVTNQPPRLRSDHTDTSVPCPTGIASPTCVLIAGGWDWTNSQPALRAEVYDPGQDRFVDVGLLSQPHRSHTSTAMPDGSVLVIGGDDSNGNAGDPFLGVERYVPATGNFTAKRPLRIARRDHTATLLPDGKLLVMGGFGRSQSSWNSGELYDPMDPPLLITTAALPDVATGAPYSASVQAAGVSPPFTYSVAFGALPPGITFAGGTFGGTATTPGSYWFTIEARNGNGDTALRSFEITVGQPLVITTNQVPNGIQGVFYDHTLTATGGVGLRTWALSDGSLPAGLFVTSDGHLQGTPAQAGLFFFTISVRDSSSPAQIDTQQLAITITIGEPAPDALCEMDDASMSS